MLKLFQYFGISLFLAKNSTNELELPKYLCRENTCRGHICSSSSKELALEDKNIKVEKT
jgi:hypothetical protein